MNEAAIRKSIEELTEVFSASACRDDKKAKTEGIYLPSSAGQDESLQDCLDRVRLQVKYLTFDLEATRRENRYLRQMLENRSNHDKDGENDNKKGDWR